MSWHGWFSTEFVYVKHNVSGERKQFLIFLSRHWAQSGLNNVLLPLYAPLSQQLL